MKNIFVCSLLLLMFISGCNTGPAAVGVTLSSGTTQAMDQGQTLIITATVPNDSTNKGVTWALAGVGAISNQTTTSVTYAASGSATGTATITATSITDTSKTSIVTITVTAVPTITTTSLPAGTQGGAYDQTIVASGGASTKTFSITSGTLPAGLALNAATGAITGTPTTAATANFSVKVTDSSTVAPQSSTPQALSIVVNPAPSITSLTQTSGAAGLPITITGANFGATQGTSTVKFNGTAAAAATVWSATSITVTVPAGATTGNVVVTVSGSPSNGSPFTVVLAPGITSLSQTSGAVGASITITGINFGATQGASTVKFNGTAAAAATVWSATSITVTVPAGATTGNVVVTVLGTASNNSPFTIVLPPSITSLSSTSGAVGTSTTITGTSFGATQGSSTVTFNGIAATASAWSATSITVTVPALATSGNVVVNVLGSASNGSPFTVVPAITSLSSTSGAIGASITITGTSFGSTQGSSTVAFNGIAATASAWSATSITVTVPALATSGNVVVTVGGHASNGSSFTVILPPSITSLSSTSGAVGSSITITGTSFGATQGSSTVTFNGIAAAAASAWSATSITVNVPAAATSGNVVVTVLGSASNGSSFTVVPTITSLSQTSGAVGASIAITGTGFGATQSSSTVAFNGTAATTASAWSATSITVNVPAGATNGNVVVTVGGQASNGSPFTIVLAPSITSLSSTSGVVGTSVTITGTNFGSTQGASTVTFHGTTATASAWSATSITVTVPSGAATGNVVVTVLGSASNGSSFTVVASCTNNCTLSGTVTGPWVSGVTITLSGSGSANTTTATNGTYSFTNLTAGTYTVTPTLPGYTYSPAPPTIAVSSNTVQNFTATSAVTSYSISGTITYSGLKTGRTFIRVFPSGCTGGCGAMAGTSISTAPSPTGTSYTVRGLQGVGGGANGDGSYFVTAEIDTLNTGESNASNPSGTTTSTVTINSSNFTGANITVSDPTIPAPVPPTNLTIAPGNTIALAQYDAPQDANGVEIATSYKIYTCTDANATACTNVTFGAHGTHDNVYILHGITNGTYYFKMTALVGATESSASNKVGPVVIGAPNGGTNTVSGKVTFSGTATGPLYVGLFNGSAIYAETIPAASLSSPQSYSISNVPSGSYQAFAIVDMDNNGVIGVGDFNNINSQQGPPPLTVTGNTTNNITLANDAATVSVATSHQQINGSQDSYNLNLNVTWGSKRPVAVTLISGPNVSVPFDLPADQNNSVQTPNLLTIPQVGDTYQFLVTFTDASTQTIPVSVTAVLNSFVTGMAMQTTTPGSPTIPLLTWVTPASVPSPYTYFVGLYSVSGSANINWNDNGGHNSNGIPSGTTSILFNDDGSASASSLLTNTQYNWFVAVQDANGNTSQETANYNLP